MEDEALFERVLLIEDETAHAMLIKRALADFCRQVDHVSSAAQALNSIKSNSYELIVTDLNLPDSTRFAHVKSLKEQSGDTPILVLTASKSLEDAVEAMKLGAKDFIVKNFDSEFREIVGLALARIRSAIELEQAAGKLRREMDALRIAVENSKDCLAVTNASGKVIYANSAFDSFVKDCQGRHGSLQEILGARVNQADKLSQALVEKSRQLQVGAVWHTEITFTDSKNIAYDLSLSVIRSDAALGNECVLWVRDISEQRRRERFQREILSTTTHDLKGPLGAILISTELLSDMVKSDTKVRELVMRVGSSAQTAVNIIDEFLSARRIQEGTFILRPQLNPIGQLVSETCESFKSVAASKSITLEVTDIVDVNWLVDKIGFQRVLGNLLSNAFKFTPKGGQVRTSSRVWHDELYIEVSDSGCGMEPSEVHSIFERFVRLEKHASVAGSGIGLFVVRSIVAAHGGKIEVTSQVGKGTTFTISFPKNPPVNDRGELISLDFA